MQLVKTPGSPRPPRVLGPSLPLELDWAVHAASSPDLRAAHSELARLYAEQPGLAERLQGFWGDGITCRPELDVLAHHAGVLETTSFSALRAAIEATIATLPADLPLTSETPDDREAILARLGALRTSTQRRGAWFELLGEVWIALDGWWQTEGIPSVEQAAAQWRHDLARGVEWQQLVTTGCSVFVSHIPAIAARQQEGDVELLLAPCSLFGKGLYLDLPGTVLVGFGATRNDSSARARTEAIARRLRAVADPTRLAILDHLAQGGASVTEIARTFSLSQPTVSSHIRKLRDAGLVVAERMGTRLEVRVKLDEITALGHDLAGLGSPQ